MFALNTHAFGWNVVVHLFAGISFRFGVCLGRPHCGFFKAKPELPDWFQSLEERNW